ncbi:MAG: cell surface protein SprA, partial [Muribaculaceae bacterium]|nr:cell surface protein SprA [Muribaculaceae bacterium]
GFKKVTHLRFATLELVRGEWRPYKFNLNTRGDTPAEGQLDISVVNIEENAGREPVNYVLPPGVNRISDPGQSQIVQLNEQSMSLKVTGLDAGDARAVYRNTQQDLRNYSRMQMWVHAESLIDDVTSLRSGDLSVFIRLGTDVKNNYYEYEVPLQLTPHDFYYDNPADRAKVWPIANFLDFNLQSLVNLKLERNAAKRAEQSGVGFATPYTSRDPDNEQNSMTVTGNPSLSDVRVMLIGIRNRSATIKSGIIWVNELKVTDFNESGGWAAKANATLNISDIATLNLGTHIETAGFGSVDQSLNERRLDDYYQYNMAVQADLGRFFPAGAKLRAPVYYSVSKEKTSPKYNPLDQDVLLKDALDNVDTKQERDSINAYAVDKTTIQNFSVSGLKFDVQSKNPMPWDPANFTVNFSFTKQTKTDPTTEYEYTNDYRGSLAYNYTPFIKPFKPFSFIKSKNKNMKFFKDWELQWLPNNISFLTNMSRYYYEQQTRSETDVMFQLPVSVSKNFLWDRQLALSWNLTKSLSLSFNSNTSARIEETIGAVNKRLFPDKYRDWKDTVWQSILSMGTPWSYNQSFTAQYKAPFSRIPAIDFLSGNVSYNATYRWDRGATVDGIELGNTIANQAAWNADGRINFETFYNKIPVFKEVTKRFANTRKPANTTRRKPKKFERSYKLPSDTTRLIIKHNLRTKKVKVSAALPDGTAQTVQTRVVDPNSVEILTKGDKTLKFTITENLNEDKNIWKEIGQYTLRLALSPRNISVRYRNTRTMNLPLFIPDVGNIFGQSRSYGPMSPGLGFAFGFEGESFLHKALERGWLMTDDGQTSPAIYSRANELNIEANLEIAKGLKVQLTLNRADNRSTQTQFMYSGMPTSYSGSFTITSCAIGTALKSSNAADGYNSEAFNNFLDYIPMMRQRVEDLYAGTEYPRKGFLASLPQAGLPFDPEIGTASTTSSDVLIPAFVAAYTGSKPATQWLTPFPSFKAVLPNWRVTYDGLINLGNLRNVFKTFTLSHAYQCTYAVGSYTSYLNWVNAGVGGDLGFTLDELSGNPIPSSPFNISSVAITERFAPLIGLNVTLKNDLQLNAEYRDQRTLTLNTSAAQVVEAS